MRHTLLFIALVLLLGITTNAQNIIGLHHGGELEYQQLRLKQPAFSKNYLLADDSIKYTLDQVNYYQINGAYFKKRFFNSGSYEFMHREQEGAIELYAVERTTQSYNPTTGIPYSSSSKISFYSKSNRSIKKVNGKNLMTDLAECDMCVQEVKKGKTVSTISNILLGAGLGIFLGTAINTLSKTPEPGESISMPPGVFIGAALCMTPWVLTGAKRKHFNRSIELYNQNY